MKISIEEKSGFCFGVTRVIKMAEEILDRGEKLYCLGQIVHNEKEVQRLIDKGLVFIENEDLLKIKNAKVLIRAHGEPPATYALSRENDLELIDGTCPIVLTLQKKIRKAYEMADPAKNRIIIYGKENHPEVRGLKGQTENKAAIVRSCDEVGELKGLESVHLFSQTTMDTEGFKKIDKYLRKWQEEGGKKELNVQNTICSHISNRQPGIIQFAHENELIIFVAGKKSSNGQVLFNICKNENENCYFVSGEDEIKSEWIKDVNSVGVCGATSTPRWLLEQIAAKIKSFT